ncbi:DnaB-like replicative helicase [Vibrio phage K436]
MSTPIDLAVLRVVKRREQWDKVQGYIPESSLDEHTRLLLEDFRRYYALHPTATAIDMDIFRSLFFQQFHRTLNKESVETYNTLINRVCDDVSAETQASIVNMLVELELVTAIANDIEEYEAGEEIDIVDLLERRVGRTKDKLEIISAAAYGTIESLVERRESGVRYKWCIPGLQQTCRDIEGGDMIIIAALSDVGKTSFTLQQIIACSVQTQKPIIWFNNEGPKERIQLRMYGMMLGIGSDLVKQYITDGTLAERLFNIYGRPDPIRIYDVHGMDNRQLEDLIKKVAESEGVGGVVWDMLDNVPFRGNNSNSRTDQILEEKYQWARQLGVLYDYPNFATSQQSYNKEWQKHPDKGELKDSKVGKQGACDMLIFMTQPVEHTKETFRYISAPKNKLSLPEAGQVRIDARFNKALGYTYEE